MRVPGAVGVVSEGFSIGGKPSPISGGNGLRFSDSWGREPAPQLPKAPPMIFRGPLVSLQCPKFARFPECPRRRILRPETGR